MTRPPDIDHLSKAWAEAMDASYWMTNCANIAPNRPTSILPFWRPSRAVATWTMPEGWEVVVEIKFVIPGLSAGYDTSSIAVSSPLGFGRCIQMIAATVKGMKPHEMRSDREGEAWDALERVLAVLMDA